MSGKKTKRSLTNSLRTREQFKIRLMRPTDSERKPIKSISERRDK